MLNNKRQNYHHSKLPEAGEIVTMPQELTRRNPALTGKWIVTHFSLCDNVLPYSVGIHLAHIEKLADRNQHATISGFYLTQD